MKPDATIKLEKKQSFKSIRVKDATKQKINKFLNKVNKSEDTGKITFDDLMNYFLENIETKDVEQLQLRTVTWVHEEKRLRKLYERQKGRITEVRWKQMLCLGELQEFFNEHSRLPVGVS